MRLREGYHKRWCKQGRNRGFAAGFRAVPGDFRASVAPIPRGRDSSAEGLEIGRFPTLYPNAVDDARPKRPQSPGRIRFWRGNRLDPQPVQISPKKTRWPTPLTTRRDAAAALRHRPDLDHRRNAPVVSRLRHERDREPGAARRARRHEAGAPAHPLFDARAELHLEPAVPQVGDRGRRRHRQVPPAWRRGGLHVAGPHGAGFFDAPAADRRAGQFRLDRRRYAGGHALHRSAHGKDHQLRCSTISRTTPSISARTTTARAASRRCCRRASRTFWSTAAAASPSAWRPTSRATISAR